MKEKSYAKTMFDRAMRNEMPLYHTQMRTIANISSGKWLGDFKRYNSEMGFLVIGRVKRILSYGDMDRYFVTLIDVNDINYSMTPTTTIIVNRDYLDENHIFLNSRLYARGSFTMEGDRINFEELEVKEILQIIDTHGISYKVSNKDEENILIPRHEITDDSSLDIAINCVDNKTPMPLTCNNIACLKYIHSDRVFKERAFNSRKYNKEVGFSIIGTLYDISHIDENCICRLLHVESDAPWLNTIELLGDANNEVLRNSPYGTKIAAIVSGVRFVDVSLSYRVKSIIAI